MATVQEIVADIKITFGSSFINARQAADYLGYIIYQEGIGK